jgi:hypothetical protein
LREIDLDGELAERRPFQILRIKRQSAITQKMRKTLLGFDTEADTMKLNAIEDSLNDLTDHPHPRLPLSQSVAARKLADAISEKTSERILAEARTLFEWRAEKANYSAKYAKYRKEWGERLRRNDMQRELLWRHVEQVGVIKNTPETCGNFPWRDSEELRELEHLFSLDYLP